MTKKEMIALTAKNYQNLPEVKNKRDVQKKKEDKMKDLRERQERVKDLDAVRFSFIVMNNHFQYRDYAERKAHKRKVLERLKVTSSKFSK